MLKMVRCRHKLRNGCRCSNCARICGYCTVHYIKSRHYKGHSHNIRRRRVKKR